MSEKYIDLIHAIESSDSMTGCERVTVEAVLAWLDAHPDQVPGRTITESRVKEKLLRRGIEFVNGWTAAMIELGATVIPDPEPTNAEKLTADLEAWGVFRSRALELGPWLAGQGWTKAPGGDE